MQHKLEIFILSSRNFLYRFNYKTVALEVNVTGTINYIHGTQKRYQILSE